MWGGSNYCTVLSGVWFDAQPEPHNPLKSPLASTGDQPCPVHPLYGHSNSWPAIPTHGYQSLALHCPRTGGLYVDNLALANKTCSALQNQTQVWHDQLKDDEKQLNIQKTKYLKYGHHWWPGFEKKHPIQISWIPGHIGRRYHPRHPRKNQCGVVEVETDHWGPVWWENANILRWRSARLSCAQSPYMEQNVGLLPRSINRSWRLRCSGGHSDWPAFTMRWKKMSLEDWESLQSRKKMRKARLRWYSHVQHSENNSVARTALRLNTGGHWLRGIPKTWWMDSITEDLHAKNLNSEDVHHRAKWRWQSKAANHVWMGMHQERRKKRKNATALAVGFETKMLKVSVWNHNYYIHAILVHKRETI